MSDSQLQAGTRKSELERNLAQINEAVAQAAKSAGRRSDDITVVAVTKTWPAADVRLLSDLGVTEFAENKAQELMAKQEVCADLALNWHFVGQLQRNKVKQVASVARCIESVDRPELVVALQERVQRDGLSPVTCLVQVSLDHDRVAGRAGVAADQAARLADQVAAADGLELGGVMGVAPRGGDARIAFETLKRVSEEISDQHRSATIISAGMSGDFVTAIEAGATHIRLGSALLGERVGFVR